MFEYEHSHKQRDNKMGKKINEKDITGDRGIVRTEREGWRNVEERGRD